MFVHADEPPIYSFGLLITFSMSRHAPPLCLGKISFRILRVELEPSVINQKSILFHPKFSHRTQILKSIANGTVMRGLCNLQKVVRALTDIICQAVARNFFRGGPLVENLDYLRKTPIFVIYFW